MRSLTSFFTGPSSKVLLFPLPSTSGSLFSDLTLRVLGPNDKSEGETERHTETCWKKTVLGDKGVDILLLMFSLVEYLNNLVHLLFYSYPIRNI